MLSVIVCSRSKDIPSEFKKNIYNDAGIEVELIWIDNSENKHSIFSAYNFGYKQSKYPYICFLHEDIIIHTKNWGKVLIEHLNQPNVGLVGLAGGNLATRIPSAWSISGKSVNIVQSNKDNTSKIHIQYPENYDGKNQSVVLLDGVFLAIRREVMEKLSFDEKIGGFHGYDFDISLQSVIAGYTNYVMYNIEVEHFSQGNKNKTYYRNLIKVFKKWEKHLPVFGNNICEEQKKNIHRIEKKRLKKLTKSMSRTGFSYREIADEIKYFSNLVNLKGNDNKLLIIYIRVFVTRLTERPSLLLK